MSLTHHTDSYTTQHTGLHFPQPIALTQLFSLITPTPENHFTITITQSHINVSWINPSSCRSDCVCPLFGLLLSFQDYLSALPLWILYADRRPTLAPRIALSCLCHTCLPLSDPACFLNMFSNKALHMDPHVSSAPLQFLRLFKLL